MSNAISDLVREGVKLFPYAPTVNTPDDDFKAVYHWTKLSEIDETTVINNNANIAVKPNYEWVDADFDCEDARELSFEYFYPHYLFGRDTKGHFLIRIKNPTKFSNVKIHYEKETLIEMRGEGCYSVLKGKLTGPEGVADVKRTDYGKDITYEEFRQKIHEIGLLCQLKRAYSGNVNDFTIPVVGEMLFQGIPQDHAINIMMRFLKMIKRSNGDPDYIDDEGKRKKADREAETRKSIINIYNKNTPSKIEKLTALSNTAHKQIEQTIIEVAKPYKDVIDISKNKGQPLVTKTLKEIQNTEYPEQTIVVEKILTTGLGFLSAKPKVGKSFLGLALSYAVATGGKFLDLNTMKGSVLYIAYEDSEARIRRRADDMGMKETELVEFAFKTDKLMDGLEQQLMHWIDDKRKSGERPLLIIIDTYVRSQDGKKGAGSNSYEIDSSKLDNLQRDILSRDVCCMFITHDKKVEEADKLNNVSGSIAFQGQDFVWHIDKNRTDGSTTSTLHVQPRDLDPQEFEIMMNDNFEWENLGTPEKKDMDKATRQLLEAVQALHDQGQVDARPGEIFTWLKANKKPEGDDNFPDTKTIKWSYQKKLKTLLKRGTLNRGDRAGSYMVPRLIKHLEEDGDYGEPF